LTSGDGASCFHDALLLAVVCGAVFFTATTIDGFAVLGDVAARDN
jgi:hypothetical protein